jgi:KUP system potassium uptake protein
MSATAKNRAAGQKEHRRALAPAALACMGVVFGDIGTSPLYTLNVAAKSASPNGQVAPEAVLGIVSLIFWSLIIVISIKYAILIMRADNHGEGGILALLALVSPRRAKRNTFRAAMVVVGLVGATLLYGDGTITPAISVLSAIEGVKIYAPQMGPAVVPLTVAILVVLFVIQRNGTSWIGGLFGPIMLIWFITAGVLGVVGIARTPAVLAALDPLAAVTYLWHAGPLAFVVIGGAFLAVTGGEAFYADLGHFGPLPIRVAWFGVALPALTLSYFGQGGLLLAEPNSPDVLDSPFYALAPHWAQFPLILLATVATVIASQSIISGAYSMTQQAINLGFLPRMNVVHTEGREIGQIYMPFVNWALAAGTLVAVIGFGSSDALAGAFGIAVSLLMVITTMMATFVALHWKFNWWIVYLVNGGLLALDLLFFASTSTKLLDGGWFPLLIAFVISFLMLTWRKGEEVMDAARAGAPGALREVRRSSSRLSAGPHPGDGHRPRPDDQGRAARTLAQCQVQSHAAGERASRGGVDDRGAAGTRREQDRGCADCRGDHPRRAALRLHGGAERPSGTGRRDGARQYPEIRSRQGDLLYRP